MAFAYFDCYNGISGDMTLGALIDLGADVAEIERQLKTMPLKDFSLAAESVRRCGIGATKATVTSHEEHPPHRHLRHIEEMIGAGSFPERARERALRAFQLLAEAEAEVHGTTVEKVHFHEVGAMDAIVDIVGSMIAAELLEIDSAAASTVAVGSGRVTCSHGEMPVPAPATALLLRGAPIETGPLAQELTTPTGAAILRTLADEFGALPTMCVERIGYGAGSRETKGHTNYLRVLLGRSEAPAEDEFLATLDRRRLELVSTEIDDMSGEIFSFLMEKLFEAGALDVHFQPLQMKKNRPAVRIEALCDPATTPHAVRLILEETTTFGARVTAVDRYCFPRRMETIQLPQGELRVKLALLGDRVVKVSPEYEDCRSLALASGAPVRQIFNQAVRLIEEKYFS
jgi:uncharacterized protein (TIGR00299 family) protein